MNNRKYLKLVLVILIAVAFVGCFRTKINRQYYVLTQPAKRDISTVSPKFSYQVLVQPPAIDPLYDRLELVYRYSPYKLEYYPHHLWSIKPQKMISEMIIGQLRQTHLFSQVLSTIETSIPDYALNTEIQNIEELSDGESASAHLAMRYQLINNKSGKVVVVHQFDRTEKVLVKSPEMVVQTLSQMMMYELFQLTVKVDHFFSTQQNVSPSVFKPPTFISSFSKTITEPVKNSIYSEIKNHESWESQPVRDQIALDARPIPLGKGALFIPAMTNSNREPLFEIRTKGKLNITGETGKKIFLAPGEYEIFIGSGVGSQLSLFKVTIIADQVNVVQPTWSGLVVRVVDERNVSIRGSYEVLNSANREVYGTGFGVDEQSGEVVQTWLLKPGLYKIIKVGETYRARKNFATVYLEPGKLTHFTLVMDSITEDFMGAGVTPWTEEKEHQKIGNWKFNSLLGGNFSFQNTNNISGIENGDTTSFSLFVDNNITYEKEKNFLNLRVELEEGQTKRPSSKDYENNLDNFDVDTIYIYRYKSWIGPYGRFNVETNFFPRTMFFDEPTTISITDNKGNRLNQLSNRDKIDLSESFSLLSFRESAGANLTLCKNVYLGMDVRIGLGARQVLVKNLYTERDQSDTTEFEIQELKSHYKKGVELALISKLRILRWIVMNTEIDVLQPFDNFDESIVNLENSLSFRLGKYASLNFITKLIRDADINTEEKPLSRDQRVLLRLSYALF
ncbi:MAG: membrane integrity-associated transporter subunit PqiC [Desulfobacterales bacterium]|nr:membrane integrity-associated transporter subunit PqiC [Desulfobacterales bacterium]